MAVAQLLMATDVNLEAGKDAEWHSEAHWFLSDGLMRNAAADGQYVFELLDDGLPCFDAGIARTGAFPTRQKRGNHDFVSQAEANVQTGRSIVDDPALVIRPDAIANDCEQRFVSCRPNGDAEANLLVKLVSVAAPFIGVLIVRHGGILDQ